MRYFLLFMAVMTVLFGVSCKDIFETDISGRKVELIAPGDSIKTIYAVQTFWWGAVGDATGYELQIVSPSFSKVEKIIMDTMISTTKFEVNLFPGKFEWRVKAINGSYETAFSARSLEIDSTSDISGQKVLLQSPQADIFTNQKSITFKWSKLYMATEYFVKVRDSTGIFVVNRGAILTDTIIESSLNEGTYEWFVQAINASGETPFASRKFTIDRTEPGTPILVTPANKSSSTQTSTTMTWTRAADKGSALFDSLYVSSDSMFTASNIIVKEQLVTPGASHDFSKGDYFWRVKSIDQAGNKSDFSKWWKFTIQ